MFQWHRAILLVAYFSGSSVYAEKSLEFGPLPSAVQESLLAAIFEERVWSVPTLPQAEETQRFAADQWVAREPIFESEFTKIILDFTFPDTLQKLSLPLSFEGEKLVLQVTQQRRKQTIQVDEKIVPRQYRYFHFDGGVGGMIVMVPQAQDRDLRGGLICPRRQVSDRAGQVTGFAESGAILSGYQISLSAHG
jgi:hypothetical protein